MINIDDFNNLLKKMKDTEKKINEEISDYLDIISKYEDEFKIKGIKIKRNSFYYESFGSFYLSNKLVIQSRMILGSSSYKIKDVEKAQEIINIVIDFIQDKSKEIQKELDSKTNLLNQIQSLRSSS